MRGAGPAAQAPLSGEVAVLQGCRAGEAAPNSAVPRPQELGMRDSPDMAAGAGGGRGGDAAAAAAGGSQQPQRCPQ